MKNWTTGILIIVVLALAGYMVFNKSPKNEAQKQGETGTQTVTVGQSTSSTAIQTTSDGDQTPKVLQRQQLTSDVRVATDRVMLNTKTKEDNSEEIDYSVKQFDLAGNGTIGYEVVEPDTQSLYVFQKVDGTWKIVLTDMGPLRFMLLTTKTAGQYDIQTLYHSDASENPTVKTYKWDSAIKQYK